jgi:RNA polymerase sigma-70 factor, ECF subfamily
MADSTKDSELPGSWLKKTATTAKCVDVMGTEATQLMIATKAGDSQAFDTLVGRLRKRAFYIAHSLVGSREDAMDLSQEAFMKVFRARETFRNEDAFLPWFHRILRNTCFSFLRQRGRLRKVSISSRQPGMEEEGDWELIDTRAASPSDRMEAQESSEEFHDALAGLSARDREILSMRHHRELSYREIAESLDIPQGTVMSRLFHARRRLRERLGSGIDGVPSTTGTEITALEEGDK